jgi:hypothetical protein
MMMMVVVVVSITSTLLRSKADLDGAQTRSASTSITLVIFETRNKHHHGAASSFFKTENGCRTVESASLPRKLEIQNSSDSLGFKNQTHTRKNLQEETKDQHETCTDGLHHRPSFRKSEIGLHTPC